jgi:hypothetical protein
MPIHSRQKSGLDRIVLKSVLLELDMERQYTTQTGLWLRLEKFPVSGPSEKAQITSKLLSSVRDVIGSMLKIIW